MILCFHQKLDDEVLVGCPLASQGGLLGARTHSVWEFIAFFDAPEGRMGRFRAPRECRVAKSPPGKFRFREENECFVFLRVRLATLGGLI